MAKQTMLNDFGFALLAGLACLAIGWAADGNTPESTTPAHAADTSTNTNQTAEGANAAKDSTILSVTEMKRLVRENKAIVVDVRTEDVFARGHIPGARHIPLNQIKGQKLSALRGLLDSHDLPFVLYCGSSSCKDSSIAAEILLQAGLPADRVLIFKGGWLTWLRERGAIETGTPKP